MRPSVQRLALALGDPNGIGPEIALKALHALSEEDRKRITVFGPAAVLQRAAAVSGLLALLPQLDHVEAGALPDSAAQPGRIDPAAGASAGKRACRSRISSSSVWAPVASIASM